MQRYLPSFYLATSASIQVFDRFFVQLQFLCFRRLPALFRFLDVGHTYLSLLMSLFRVKKVCFGKEGLIRSGIVSGQRTRLFLASELRLIKPGEKIVEHQLVRALGGTEQVTHVQPRVTSVVRATRENQSRLRADQSY
jgi:hypothetical protein